MVAERFEGPDRAQYGLFIDNDFAPASSGETFDSLDPSTGLAHARLSAAGGADVERAAAGAAEAARGWWGHDGARRGQVLYAWADLIERNGEHLAEIESRDNGRPIRETRSQAAIYPKWFRYFAGLADKIQGETVPVGDGYLNYTTREPLGVVAAITPWNHPLLIASKKIAPALAAGNALLLKPSELAPCSLLEVARLGREAGLPPGVLQVLTGAGPTGALVARAQGVSRIDVTGSTHTGKLVALAAAERLAEFGGELGGNTPVLIFDDIDASYAAKAAQFSGYIGSGQTCIAGSRIFVQRGIYADFIEALVARVAAMRVGRAQDRTTDMGPVISAAARDRVLNVIRNSTKEGAHIAVGGGVPSDPKLAGGFFIEPTVIVDARNDMACAQNEVFGPVLTVIPFDSEQEVTALANGTSYGLGASIWTHDVARAHRVARELRIGTVWINTHHRNHPGSPWGGFKNSGIGRENGIQALWNYTAIKSVWVSCNDEPISWYDTKEDVRLN